MNPHWGRRVLCLHPKDTSECEAESLGADTSVEAEETTPDGREGREPDTDWLAH